MSDWLAKDVSVLREDRKRSIGPRRLRTLSESIRVKISSRLERYEKAVGSVPGTAPQWFFQLFFMQRCAFAHVAETAHYTKSDQSVCVCVCVAPSLIFPFVGAIQDGLLTRCLRPSVFEASMACERPIGPLITWNPMSLAQVGRLASIERHFCFASVVALTGTRFRVGAEESPLDRKRSRWFHQVSAGAHPRYGNQHAVFTLACWTGH